MQGIQTFLEVVQPYSQNSQSAASGHVSVPHTRQPRPWVRGVKGSAEFLGGEEEGCCHFPVGEITQRAHLTGHTEGHDSGWKMGLRTAMGKKKKRRNSSQNKRGWVGKDTKLTDIENHPERPNEKAILDFHLKRFEVSGIHLSSRPAPPPMWPKLK